MRLETDINDRKHTEPVLLAAARSGDERAFEELTLPLRRELHVHCYRMLGSQEDVDDALQETLLRSWQGLDGFEPRAPFRAWLYRIATNVCLTVLAQRSRRSEVAFEGAEITRGDARQRVAALTQIGAHAQYISLPAGELVRLPAGVDAAEAASLPVNYVTAHQMLFRVAKVKPGKRSLVHGAAGGVGTTVLQLGGLQGLEMYGTASAGKHDLVSGLGATPIDYKAEDFVERVRALTGDGVDAVFDHIGGAHVARSFGTLRRGGRLVGYGLSSGLAGRAKPSTTTRRACRARRRRSPRRFQAGSTPPSSRSDGAP